MNTASLADSELPGLPLAFDAGRLEQELNERARRQGGDIRISGLAFDRFRYRAGKRAVFLYRCFVDDAEGGEPVQSWVAADLYKGSKASKTYARMQTTCEAGSGACAPGAVLIEDAGMLCTLFPFDPKLPGLEQAAASRLAPLRYRPRISATFLDETTDAPSFVKYVQPEEFRSVTDAGWQAYVEVFAALSGLALPQLLEAHEAAAMLRWSKVAGTAMSDELQAGHRSGTVAAAAGTAMGRVASASGDLVVESAPWRQAQGQFGRLLDFLSHQDLAGQERVDRIRSGLFRAFEQAKPGLVHGDLKPEHILSDGDMNLGLVDIETLGPGLPMIDAGNLCARLCMCEALHAAPSAAGGKAAEAFANAWLDAARDHTPDSLAAGMAAGFVRLATYFVQHATPGWRQRMYHCIEVAERSLRGGLPWH